MLVDEIHVWKGRDLWEALRTGMVKTSGTLMVIATTAGRGAENLGYDQYVYARKVATGEIDDPSFLPIIFEPEADDDWRDEAVWHRVNPGLAHGFPNLDGLRTMAREAEHRPPNATRSSSFTSTSGKHSPVTRFLTWPSMTKAASTSTSMTLATFRVSLALIFPSPAI